ncbi:MAG: translational GTPase TypA [Myxococcales bacterium]|nr:translational GTPase TypA [Myxococcales bacterium]
MASADIRNLAIIAHVDHGKTTLVDGLLAAAGALERREGETERALDSNDLERERGITITSKPTSLEYRGTRINLVDTPGHADFGGEVERVLNMVDAALLVVDAFEGPMPQTRFVTEKAVKAGLRILLVVNKIDRPGCEPHKAVDATFDLLASLDASEEQLDFPVIYCSARERYAMADPDDPPQPMHAILDFILAHAPQPRCQPAGGFAMWVSTLDYDPFLGYVAIGRIQSGRLGVGDRVALVRPEPGGDARAVEVFRARKLLGFQGLRRFEREEAFAGDIVAICGMETLGVGDTLTTEDPATRTVFPTLAVDPPTMAVRIRVNDGPFAGREGQWVTSRKIAERLTREVRSNVALRVSTTDSADEFEVAGRGELHLSVLIETMRREGYELCVSRPRVILREDEDGVKEPFERLTINCESPYAGAVIDKLGQRFGEMIAMDTGGEGRTRMEFLIPTRSLIGYRSELLTDTRGTGIMASTFAHYGRYLGARKSRARGVLVVMDPGETNTYSLHRLQDRGSLFVGSQVPVYAGMIVGEHCRENDLIVNPCITKKLTNVRSSGADEKLFLTPPIAFSLEQALAYLDDDELLEVTPKSLRLRKRLLDHNARKREEKAAALG